MQKFWSLIFLLSIKTFCLKAQVVLADRALAQTIIQSPQIKNRIKKQLSGLLQESFSKTTLESVMAFGDDSEEGFASGTIVKTPDGDRTIESLRPGDSIFSFDFKSRKPISDFVVCIQKRKVKNCGKIAVLDNQGNHAEVITCSALQRFFCMRTMDFQEYWKQGNLIWTQECRPQIDATFFLIDFYRKLFCPRYHEELLLGYSFEQIDAGPTFKKWYARPKILITRLLKSDYQSQDEEVYTLTVANNDNLFVTRNGILVHNTTPPFIVGIGIASEGVGFFDAACNMAVGIFEVVKTGSLATSGLQLFGWVGIGAFCAYAAYKGYRNYENGKNKDKKIEQEALDPINRGFNSTVISCEKFQEEPRVRPILSIADTLACGPIAQVKNYESINNDSNSSSRLICNLPFVSIGLPEDSLKTQDYINAIRKSAVLESWSASEDLDFQDQSFFYPFDVQNLQDQNKQNAILANGATATLIALQAYQKHCDSKIGQTRRAEMEASVEAADQTTADGPRKHTPEDQLKRDARKQKKEAAKAAAAIEKSKKKRDDEKETVVDVEAANRDLDFFDESLDAEYWANWTIEKDMPLGQKVINGRTYTMHALERMAPDRPDVRAELERRAYWDIANKKIVFEDNDEEIKHVKERVQPRGISPKKVEYVIKHAKDGGTPDKKHPGNKNYWYNKILVILSGRPDNFGSVISVFWNSDGC